MKKETDLIGLVAFGRTRTSAHKNQICVRCESPKGEFRDKLSEREYEISGLCQKCQDVIFVDNDE